MIRTLVFLFLLITTASFAQTDSAQVQLDSIVPMGEKFDTITFQGVLLENPLVVKQYRQIVKTRYAIVNGQVQQQYLDSWFEMITRRKWVRIKAQADDFMFSKRI